MGMGAAHDSRFRLRLWCWAMPTILTLAPVAGAKPDAGEWVAALQGKVEGARLKMAAKLEARPLGTLLASYGAGLGEGVLCRKAKGSELQASRGHWAPLEECFLSFNHQGLAGLIGNARLLWFAPLLSAEDCLPAGLPHHP